MEIQDIIQGLTQTEINAITSPDERSLIVNTTLNQAVIYVNGTFKQSSFENTDDIPEGTNKFATSADLSAITANTAKVSFPEAPNDGKQYARKDLGWEEVAASGTSQPLPIIALTSTDNSSTFTEASPLIISWDVESEKDTGFTHSNSTNNSRITVSDNSTYQFGGALRIFNNSDQRIQPLPKLRIDGVVQDIAVDSGYIRNSGSASDYWSLEFTFRPLKLTANQYVEIQIGLESSNPVTFDGTLIGDESNFWGVKLQGEKGEKGDTGTGSNIVVKKDGVTIGTLTDAIDILGGVPVVDEGGNVTSIEIGNYAHATGITQMPDSQITRYTETGGAPVDIDNYDLGTSNVHFIDPDAHDRDFTGMIAPSAGVNRIVTIINSGTNKKLKFKDNDSASSASNRMLLADTSDFDLTKGGSLQMIYNHDVNRWTTYSYY
jgi:hypothetical protein